MKKTWVIVVNVLIMVAMLTFVVIYSGIESRNTTQVQIEHFENTTITMRHVTENYLEGEQRICDVWARYINSNDLTIEDAVSFIRISHVLPNASAHIVYVDTLSGLSTKARQTTSTDFQSLSDPETVLLIDSWEDQAALDAHHASPMMSRIASLMEKNDLHMSVERFVGMDDNAADEKYIRR